MSAQIGYVGHHADPSRHAGRRQPGAARRRRSVHLGAEGHAPAALRRAAARHDDRDDRARGRAAGTTRCRRACASARDTALEFLASYTLGKGTTNNRGFYGVFGGTGLQGVTSATEGAYWQNTYDPEAEWGPAFHDVRHNFIVSGHLRAAVRQGTGVGIGSWSGVTDALLGGWRLGGIFQARSGLPITVIDGRRRSLQGERGSERPNCVGDPVAADQSIDHWLDINAFRRRPARHVRQLPGRRRTRARLHRTSIWCCRSGSRSAARATPNSGSRRSTRSITRASGHRPATSRRRTRSASITQHDQLAARRRARVQVLLLTRRSGPHRRSGDQERIWILLFS